MIFLPIQCLDGTKAGGVGTWPNNLGSLGAQPLHGQRSRSKMEASKGFMIWLVVWNFGTFFLFFHIFRRSAPRYFLVCGLVQVKCLSQGSPLKHDGRRKTTKRKNEQKGFKGSSTGPPGEEIPRVPLRDLRGEKIKLKI